MRSSNPAWVYIQKNCKQGHKEKRAHLCSYQHYSQKPSTSSVCWGVTKSATTEHHSSCYNTDKPEESTLNEISQSQNDNCCMTAHKHMTSQSSKIQRQTEEWWLPGLGDGKETVHEFSFTRWKSSRDLLYNDMCIVNTASLYSYKR